ncbi:hypothetical protein [Vibrio mediterranei]|uniref:hypothetical protein n=1 Tax=Vibrio mediterranei TaxID=689 RepID=UPI002284B91D|nr:hypothetical protein [Vibrio mediterranei]MCY9856029.1 hypothetical protein [Vibrio mediterranei]
MSRNNKFCIFCGQKPSNKNKEHILPKWLLSMTGDPNREVSLGRNWNSKELEVRKYNFSSYTFPACKSCNDQYGVMEREVKPIIQRIEAGFPINLSETDLLLDWFDKVRTGLWLASFYLNKNWRSIEPSFYINQRVGQKDRCLFLYKSADPIPGLTILGVDTPLFDSMPSVFGLRIEGMFFISISTDMLLHKAFGLPVIKNKTAVVGKDGHFINFERGSERIIEPDLMTKYFPPTSTGVYQPIMRVEVRAPESSDNEFSSEYCRKLFNHEQYKGPAFLSSQFESFSEFSPNYQRFFSPNRVFSNNYLSAELSCCIADLQRDLYNEHVTFDGIEGDDLKFYEQQKRSTLALHNVIIDTFKQQAMEYL